MRDISFLLRCAVLLALGFGPFVHAGPPPADLVTGTWLWQDGATKVTFDANGTFTADNGSKGTWQFLHNPEFRRKYRVDWDNGKFILAMVLSVDGRIAQVQGTDPADHYSVHRTVATAAAPIVPALPAVATVPAGPADVLLGTWSWRDETNKVTFDADGTFKADNGSKGTWQFLHNPDFSRKYRLDWDHGKSVDVMTLSTGGNVATVLGSQGEVYSVRRAPSDATTEEQDGQAAYFGTPVQ